MTDEDTTGRPAAGQALVTARLVAGLFQGLALYLLYFAAEHKVWLATDGQIYAPLLFVSFAAPVIFILSIGNLRPRTTLFWVLAATALSAFIGWYDIWHGWPTHWMLNKQLPTIVPSALSMFGTAVLLFITHALVAGGDHDRRLRATYPTHFDISWKLSLQLALAFVFFLVFWAMLWLGAALFGLVKLTFFRELLLKAWFYIPVSAATTALALHVTDVRPALVRGARTLVLALLSWLLPVMTAMAGR